jgi:hypothetical protein
MTVDGYANNSLPAVICHHFQETFLFRRASSNPLFCFFNIGSYGGLFAHEMKLVGQNKKRFVLHQGISECAAFFTIVTIFVITKVRNSFLSFVFQNRHPTIP